MYSLTASNRFKKDFKLCKKRNYDLILFDEVLDLLLSNGELTSNYNPHLLKGNYVNHWECHINPVGC